MNRISHLFQSFSATYLAFATRLKELAGRNGMLNRADVKVTGLPFSLAYQLLWSVLSMGFILEASPVARQMPLFGILLGLSASVLLFVATRLVTKVFEPITASMGKGWTWLPIYLLVMFAYLGAMVSAPATVIWLISRVLPLSVHPVAILPGMWVLAGDTLLSNLTGISLYLPRKEPKAEAQQEPEVR